jgi:hypothetical protein
MRNLTPKKLLVVGFIGVSLGVLLPLLMVMGYLPSTYFLNFLSYACSVVGLGTGIIGISWQKRLDEKKRPPRESREEKKHTP